MRSSHLGWRGLVACAVPLALASCVGSSRPSRFYTLMPRQVASDAASAGPDATLAVGPVEIPGDLDRSQIVTRTGANELAVADFERWGGPLDAEVTRSLVATLSQRLAAQRIAVVPWRSATLAPDGSRYRAVVSLSRFDGVLGQEVVLTGRWELLAEGAGPRRSVAARDATVTVKVEGAGYDALVAAMEQALVRFGQELADGVSAAAATARTP